MNNSRRRRVVVGLVASAAIAEIVGLGAMLVGGAYWAVVAWELYGWVWLALGIVLVAASGYGTYRFLRAAWRRRFQFSIRTLLIVTFVFALLMGTAGRQFQRYLAITRMLAAGGRIMQYDFEEQSYHHRTDWLYSRLGYYPFARPREVAIASDEALRRMADEKEYFAEVDGVVLSGVTDEALADVEALRWLPRLKNINVMGGVATDATLESLARWSKAELLFINSEPGITDDGLKHLQRMKSLKDLSLFVEGGGTLNVSDLGLPHLQHVAHLESLQLAGPTFTDAGLVHIAQMTQLKQVRLVRTRVTNAGEERLRAALPNCRVTRYP